MRRDLNYLSKYAGGGTPESCGHCDIHCATCEVPKAECQWCRPRNWNSYYCVVVGCNVWNKKNFRLCSNQDIIRYILENV